MEGANMKLVDNLKKKVEKTHTKEEFKSHNGGSIAGTALDDDVLEKISGGVEVGAAAAAGKAGKVTKKVIK